VRYGKTTGLAEERRRNGVIGAQPLFHSHRLVGVDFSIRTAGNDFRTHGRLLPDISLGGCSIWGKLIGFVGYVFPYRTGYYTHAFDAIGFSAYVRVIYRPY